MTRKKGSRPTIDQKALTAAYDAMMAAQTQLTIASHDYQSVLYREMLKVGADPTVEVIGREDKGRPWRVISHRELMEQQGGSDGKS